MTDLTLFQSKNRAQGQFESGIGASDLQINLKAGEGAEFPQPITGSATSGGDAITLNSTGIQAAGVAVGDFIRNVTDESYAFVTAVSTNSVTTTPLRGGSGNTWDSSDVWRCKEFVVSLNSKDADGVITAIELARISNRSTDVLTVPSGGRGFGGTSALEWSADDYVEIFVISEHNTEVISLLGDLEGVVADKANTSDVTELLNQRNWKAAVRVATTAAGTLSSDFENGDSIDGVTLATGDRILIKDQASAPENGIYTVNASGAPTRATDMDENDEVLGAIVVVREGTSNADLIFQVTSDTDPFTIGTDDMVWAQYSGGLSVASQAEAEAGTNNTKYMTPLRTSQAIAALGAFYNTASDPASPSNGETWYNTTDSAFRGAIDVYAWNSGGNLSTARQGLGGAGDTSAGLTFGGNTGAFVTTTEEYNGTSWSGGGALSTARYSLGGAGTQSDGLAIAGIQSSNLNSSEEYNGTSWSAGGTLGTAVRENAGIGASSSAALSVGGFTTGYASATEEYNGTTWSVGGSISIARTYGAGGGIDTDGLFFGGWTGSINEDATESYNGTSWSSEGDLNTARAYLAGAGSSSSACVSFGGFDDLTTTESYNGSAWSSQSGMSEGRERLAGSGSLSSAFSAGGQTSAVRNTTEEWQGTAIKDFTLT